MRLHARTLALLGVALVALLLPLAGCGAREHRRAPEGYPTTYTPVSAAARARREAAFRVANPEPWARVETDQFGYVNVAVLEGVSYQAAVAASEAGAEPGYTLGPLDANGIARWHEQVLRSAPLFGIEHPSRVALDIVREHPGAAYARLVQRADDRVAAIMNITWHGPGYDSSNRQYSREMLRIDGHHWPGVAHLPSELTDAELAAAADDDVDWRWVTSTLSDHTPAAEGTYQYRASGGELVIRWLSIQRRAHIVQRREGGGRGELRRIALMSWNPSGRQEQRDAVTGEDLTHERVAN